MATREERKQEALNELYEGWFVKAIYAKNGGERFYTVRKDKNRLETHFVLPEGIFFEFKHAGTIVLKSSNETWREKTEIWVYWEENPNDEFII